MSAFFGADVGELREFARLVDASARQLDGIQSNLTGQLAASRWIGPDGTTFVAAWHGQHRPNLARAGSILAAVAAAVFRNADEQDSASASDGASGSGTTPTQAIPASFGGAGSDPGVSTTADGTYTIGPPSRPDITWDEDFEYDSKDSNFSDFGAAAKWKSMMAAARLARWDLGDALDAYDHYWSNTGDPWHFDYDSAAQSDPAISRNVDAEISRSQAAAEEFIASGQGDFSFTGAPSGGEYPETENWQKAIGAYQQWSSADVSVSGNQATMTVTVHAEDHYNFNRGQNDIASGASDDENGRFTEIGWAKPFDSSGSVTRTITWTIGDPSSTVVQDEPDER
ncbi:hypothetical protein SAMN06295879_1639 [Agreia bicolorata]|uniref:Uncharacterized protein n=1 Tax=Agreia bicolorata TaxID=110935 RepID=A0A1T4XUY6_9MICO|nr:hypothetical protein [Agreia bicolorata]SKA93213.1 hypothetical protein SAMN06295879_1639 [Agreia bicolorata]